MMKTKSNIDVEEASEIVGDLKDNEKVEEVDSPPKTIKKQSKYKDLQEVVEKENFSGR